MLFNRFKKIKKEKLIEGEPYYVDENGLGIIDVGAGNFDDIFSYYDLDGTNVLDEEFNEFLQKKSDAIPLKTNLKIRFHVKDSSESKRRQIAKAMKDNYEREFFALTRTLKRNNTLSLWLFLIGIAFLGLYFLTLNKNNWLDVLNVILEIFCWIFIWEAVDTFFTERIHIEHQRKNMYRLMTAKIEVVEYDEKLTQKQNAKKKFSDK